MSPASPIPSQRPVSVERAQRDGLARLGLAQDGVDRVAAAVGRAAGPAQQRRLTDLGLPAADRAAAAGRAVRVDRHVPDLAAVAGDAGQRRAVDDQPPPTPTRPQTNTTSSTPMAAPRRCSARAPRSASLATAIGTSRPSAPAEPLAERFVAPAEVGGHRDEAVAPPDDADDGDADADERSSSGRRARGAAAASSARSADDVVDADACRVRPVDPDELEDVAAEPDHRGGQRVDGDLEGEHDRRRRGSGGRPARGGQACLERRRLLGRRGRRRPARRCRPRIALRVRPVRATSSERDAGPLPWSSRTIALRFARRTVSLRWPRPSRRIATGLCSSLLKCVCETRTRRRCQAAGLRW